MNFNSLILILVMLATDAVSERSFSALCGVKTWLRTITGQARLNWYLTLHAHKERTDALSMTSNANEFCFTESFQDEYIRKILGLIHIYLENFKKLKFED